MKQIDVIIPWVDGNDPEWQAVFNKYTGKADERDSNTKARYRDWDNLQYLFRGIEKFMPWVRTVHLVTCGQKPSWLNLNAPKLNFVTHREFIPNDCLPTFSIRPIELNIHRIEGLAERFIYFNDDFFVLQPLTEDFFFKDGKPVDIAALNALNPGSSRTLVSINNLLQINKHFKKSEVIQKNKSLWFKFSYGKFLFKTLCLIPWDFIPGFQDTHMPQPFLKSTYNEVWDKCGDVLSECTRHRFRDISDVNQSLFRYWQIALGNISGCNSFKNRCYYLVDDCNVDNLVSDIKSRRKPILIMNDGDNIIDFETAKQRVIDAFDTILPEKSSFEL